MVVSMRGVVKKAVVIPAESTVVEMRRYVPDDGLYPVNTVSAYLVGTQLSHAAFLIPSRPMDPMSVFGDRKSLPSPPLGLSLEVGYKRGFSAREFMRSS